MFHRSNPRIDFNGQRYEFAFRSAYMGETDFHITAPGAPTFRATLRHALPDYERRILNYDADGIRKHVEAAIGLLVRCTAFDAGEITAETVAAFNAWQARENADLLAYMIAHPDRYGPEADLRAEFPAPVPVAAGRWTSAHGWQRVDVPAGPIAQAA